MRKLLALPIAMAVMLLVGQQAQAATLTWTDEEGDAVTLFLPEEPTLDILQNTLSSDGSELVWEVDMKELADGAPPESIGYHFQLDFDIGDAVFNIRLTEDPVNEGVRLRTVDTMTGQISTQVECETCTGEINRDDTLVNVVVPLEELAALSEEVHGDEVPIAAGTELEGIEAISFRSAGALYFVADRSPAEDSLVL